MRLYTTALAFLAATAAFATEISDPVMSPETTATGAVSVHPNTGVSGEFGTWTVTYRAGAEGIAQGGGIRVQLPDAWHAGPRNSANRLQATDPADEHYVSAAAADPAVTLRAIVEEESPNTLIKHAKPSLDGRLERYVFVVRVVVESGALAEGDQIHVIYGDTTQGSRGYRAGAVSTQPLPVLLAVDTTGHGNFRLHASQPQITLHPGPPVELQFHAQSNAVIGQPLPMLISTLDKEDNPARAGSLITLRVVHGAATIPDQITIPEGQGYAEFNATPTAQGILRVEAISAKWVLNAVSNPVQVTQQPPGNRIYWGDLHSHTSYSWDGVGGHAFQHARYTAGLDFYAMTDHSRAPQDGLPRGLGPDTWAQYTALTDAHHDPPRFVTIHAYEASFGTPYGHHNVYFRGQPGPLIAPENHTLPDFWAKLTQGHALTIPHHTGKFPRNIDFTIHHEGLRRNFEIYSGHGLSETYDPLHPLAFEHSLFTSPAQSLDEPSHAQDAWRMGLQLSTVAASDDHRAHPGLPHFGLTAVFAPQLTRDAIFQALYDRRTYATTGAKILLDFQINGTPMGQAATTNHPPEITIHATGTGAISRVELLRLNAGDEKFHVIQTWNPDQTNTNLHHTDQTFHTRATYYVRLRQAAPIRGRIPMAWSSPIWLQSPTTHE